MNRDRQTENWHCEQLCGFDSENLTKVRMARAVLSCPMPKPDQCV